MTLPDTNLLGTAQSPYLLQHADNPVHWRPWGPEALAEAKATAKPILLSVGYAACHWCHVMAHESFEDPAVAAVMNRLYVNIKVDREERPDVDQIYMAALHALGEQGGWPLTMFLTPDGGPIWGGTYFPKEPRWGRPGFVQVLEEIARIWREEPKRAEASRKALTEAITAKATAATRLHRGLLDQAAEQLLTLADPVEGGTRGAPKFPQATLLELFWRAGSRTGNPAFHDHVIRTLCRMAQGGIYDHVGGGFARYSVDDRWLVPHFEKMLYDNGLLLDHLTFGWLKTRDPLFRDRIEETVAWLDREMLTPSGAFSASLDADSEGHEGKFYVWTAEQIAEALDPDAALFAEVYDVTPGGNWEGSTILNRSHLGRSGRPDRLPEADEARLARCRDVLLERRARRVRPGLDDKILADWNGYTIAALARAATVLDRPVWLERASEAYRFINGSMTLNDRFGHSWRGGALIFPGLATDFAAMIAAALALHAASGLAAYLDDARRWTKTLDAHYWDPTAGGYFLTADDAEALIIRPKSPMDEATPNANGVMAENLVRLWILTGDDRYRQRADHTLAAFSGDILRNVFGAASLLNALDTRLEPVQLVVIAPKDTDPAPLVRIASESTDRRLVTLVLGETGGLPHDHPAHGRGAVDGRPTAYLCRGNACSLPCTEPDHLAAALAERA